MNKKLLFKYSFFNKQNTKLNFSTFTGPKIIQLFRSKYKRKKLISKNWLNYYIYIYFFVWRLNKTTLGIFSTSILFGEKGVNQSHGCTGYSAMVFAFCSLQQRCSLNIVQCVIEIYGGWKSDCFKRRFFVCYKYNITTECSDFVPIFLLHILIQPGTLPISRALKKFFSN